MRIDSSPSASYSLNRGAPAGTAVTPYREVSKGAETRREPTEPVLLKPSNSAASSDRFPATPEPLTYQRPLNSHAAQALASYSITASYVSDVDALEVLGLDLYA
ncbi:hypothetical protein NVV93_14120 [Pseudomonas sp. LS44]|uniref:hypothetical protein n=1 Tax=Pseudomonas sp. LS44 TaxID=1357074 RepID=UPI00215A2557|nr:hypothetical protein [Pseudomonas sp. LS44]UVE16728.1 hypothetical protein NVV93_14120 [Pseudomonas sp. LS44]